MLPSIKRIFSGGQAPSTSSGVHDAALDGPISGLSDGAVLGEWNAERDAIERAAFDMITGRRMLYPQDPTARAERNQEQSIVKEKVSPESRAAVECLRSVSEEIANQHSGNKVELQSLLRMCATDPYVLDMHLRNLAGAEFVTRKLTDEVLTGFVKDGIHTLDQNRLEAILGNPENVRRLPRLMETELSYDPRVPGGLLCSREQAPRDLIQALALVDMSDIAGWSGADVRKPFDLRARLGGLDVAVAHYPGTYTEGFPNNDGGPVLVVGDRVYMGEEVAEVVERLFSRVDERFTNEPREQASPLHASMNRRYGGMLPEENTTVIFEGARRENLQMVTPEHLRIIAFHATYVIDEYFLSGSRKHHQDALPEPSEFSTKSREELIHETALRMLEGAIEYKCGKLGIEATRGIFNGVSQERLAALNITEDQLQIYAFAAVRHVNEGLAETELSSWEQREPLFREVAMAILDQATIRTSARVSKPFEVHDISVNGLCQFRLRENYHTEPDGLFVSELSFADKSDISYATTLLLDSLARSGFIKGDYRYAVNSVVFDLHTEQAAAVGSSQAPIAKGKPVHNPVRYVAEQLSGMPDGIDPYNVTVEGLAQLKPRSLHKSDPYGPYKNDLSIEDRADLAFSIRVFTEAFRRSGYITGSFNERIYNELTRIFLASRVSVGH